MEITLQLCMASEAASFTQHHGRLSRESHSWVKEGSYSAAAEVAGREDPGWKAGSVTLRRSVEKSQSKI